MLDAVVVSDIHLGSELCRAKDLREFLDGIDTQKLIINGDLFDSHDFRRLTKNHWGILSDLRKLSKHTEIIITEGNHDRPIDVIAPLIGVEAEDEYILYSGDKRILLLHGDRFDDFITKHPIITWIADIIYYGIQKISYGLARHIKRNSKTFLRCAEKMHIESLRYMVKKHCDMVCVGHSHHAEANDNYYNSGCWTESPCTYLEVMDGKISLCFYP